MLELNDEKIEIIQSELEVLLQDHWKEVALHQDIRPLDVDWEAYKAFTNLYVLTLREDGKLIGYASWFISPHPHYKKWLQAVNDVYYLSKEHRGKTSVIFFKLIEDWMIRHDVKSVVVQDKIHQSRERFFHYMGYKTIEQVYEKTL